MELGSRSEDHPSATVSTGSSCSKKYAPIKDKTERMGKEKERCVYNLLCIGHVLANVYSVCIHHYMSCSTCTVYTYIYNYAVIFVVSRTEKDKISADDQRSSSGPPRCIL